MADGDMEEEHKETSLDDDPPLPSSDVGWKRKSMVITQSGGYAIAYDRTFDRLGVADISE